MLCNCYRFVGKPAGQIDITSLHPYIEKNVFEETNKKVGVNGND